MVSGSVAFAMDRAQFGLRSNNHEQARYWQWCKDANAELYGYDFTESRYNLGRAPVGRASQTYSQMENILNATPYVVGVQQSKKNESLRKPLQLKLLKKLSQQKTLLQSLLQKQ